MPFVVIVFLDSIGGRSFGFRNVCKKNPRYCQARLMFIAFAYRFSKPQHSREEADTLRCRDTLDARHEVLVSLFPAVPTQEILGSRWTVHGDNSYVESDMQPLLHAGGRNSA